MKKLFLFITATILSGATFAQDTTHLQTDSLRIINYSTNFTQHVDSSAVYQFRINKTASNYFWQLTNAPVGLTINKDNGQLIFKAAKNYFLTGKLKYDTPYTAGLVIKSLLDPADKIDTSITISFYNTEIISSKIKLSVMGPITIEENEKLSFRVQCENGTFPIENILFSSSIPINEYNPVAICGQEFSWTPGYDFVKDGEKPVTLMFSGTTKYRQWDSVAVRVIVKNALNYPLANAEYEAVTKNVRSYVLQLKYVFLQLDKKLKRVKSFRTGFDLSSAGSATAGTILSTSSSEASKKTGRILPSVGVALVPIKEATAPNKTVEQNQAAQIRTAIKRLDYMITDNVLAGDRDPDITRKTQKLKEELKQVQVQLVDIPVELTGNMTEEELNNYFNSPKVNKKYRLKKK